MIKLSACIMLIAKDVKHAIKLADELEKSGKFSAVTANVQREQVNVTRAAVPNATKGPNELAHIARHGILSTKGNYLAVLWAKLKVSPAPATREEIAKHLVELKDSGRLTKDSFSRYLLDGKLLMGNSVETVSLDSLEHPTSEEDDCDEVLD